MHVFEADDSFVIHQLNCIAMINNRNSRFRPAMPDVDESDSRKSLADRCKLLNVESAVPRKWTELRKANRFVDGGEDFVFVERMLGRNLIGVVVHRHDVDVIVTRVELERRPSIFLQAGTVDPKHIGISNLLV